MSDDGTLTWRVLRAEASAEFGQPQGRWLCEEASGAFDDEFDALLDDPATERSVAHLDAMTARLRAGEPIQYVLGHWSFRRLDLMVDGRVLIPRPETELLVERAIAAVRGLDRDPGSPWYCADLGTGSGAVGLSLLAELPRGAAEVWMTDVSLDALDVARANLGGIGMAGAGARFAHGAWFDALPGDMRGLLHLVVSNPPYVADDDPALAAGVRDWEPHTALFGGDDGLRDLRAIVGGAPGWLRPGGWLMVEIGSGLGAAVSGLMEEAGLVDVSVTPDLAGLDRIVAGRLPRSGA
jgi:release factor glutamine methyltransferase